MSSPARLSAASQQQQQQQVQGGSGGGASHSADDTSPIHYPPDHISAHDRKEEALIFLKSDVMAALQKEVKSLDEDNWKFAGPRSRIHLISRPGSHPFNRIRKLQKEELCGFYPHGKEANRHCL